MNDMYVRPSLFITFYLIVVIFFCNPAGIILFLAGAFNFSGPGIFFFFFGLVILSLNWALWKSLKDRFFFISFNETSLTIFKPMRLKRIRLNLSDIKGYSKSLDDESYGTAIFNRIASLCTFMSIYLRLTLLVT
jgi:hypothetical protein